ncbi:MAG TPA: tetratricopeptide repeat protein [Opitutaceae bacterium]
MRVFGAGKTRRAVDWALVVLTFAVTLACYWPALNGAPLWDDPAHITRPELRDWSGLVRICTEVGATQEFYPVLHAAFWLEHRLWGDATLGYHLINIVLHAGSCCLLALILRGLWTSRHANPPDGTDPEKRPVLHGAEWLAALLFAVHPVCVESVAWITEQKNTLSLFLYLLAAATFLRFVQRPRWASYTAALILFFLALAAKPATVTLPAALLVVLWWKNGRLEWRRDLVPTIPFFALAAAAGLVTVWVETELVGAKGAGFDWTLLERVLLAARVTWFYLGKLVWPLDLSFYYERWDVPAEAGGWWPYLLAALGLTVMLWAIRRRTRGPLAAWMLFVGSLFPVLGFFNVFGFTFSQVADHFQYQPCMIFTAAFAGGLSTLLSRTPARLVAAACGMLGVALVGLGAQSHRRSALYVNNETLFRSVIAQNPASWMAHHILGVELSRQQGRGEEAIAHFRAALTLDPEFPDSHLGLGAELAKTPGGDADALRHYERALELRPHYAEAHNALGGLLAKHPARLPEAIAHFEEALRLRPRLAEAHVNLANALARDPARLPKAVAHYEEALHLRPDFAKAHNDYGLVLARLPGRSTEAITRFEEALRLNPSYVEALCNLANTVATLPGRTSDAIAHYEQALRIHPKSAQAHYGLANVLALQSGRAIDAVSHYEAALEQIPEFAEAHANLANLLSRTPGRSADAIAHYQVALRIDPDLSWVHFNLALHLGGIPGRVDDAFSHFKEALRIKPDYPDALNGLAILLAQQGRYEEARTRWLKALEIDPDYQTARQNLRLLEQMTSQPR